MAPLETLKIKFDAQGLVPAIIQEADTLLVLMHAYMNEESLKKTLQTGETWFYSRSRQKLWHKGEESGHIQKIKKIFYDCDNDTLLIQVQQVGDTACHTGKKSCFFNEITGLPLSKIEIEKLK
jgi:phosphoribosyl-ATP pyrophosphohydrolase/phosphoribosyl-AMP cyclohydrolase